MATQGDIINCSWGDHVEWGQGEAALNTPAEVAAGVRRWKERYGAAKIFWRGANRTIERFARIFQQPGTPTRKYFENMAKITMDEFQTICDACHAEGLPVYLYLSIFDEGWPPEAGWDRPMCWQSEFTIAHPEYLECDRAGKAVN